MGLAAAQPGFPLAPLKAFVEQEFAQIKHVLHGISLLGQCPDSINAALICRGEKMSIAIMAGLLPIMWGTGTGSEVMSRIAAPMVGGMISSTVLTLAVIPAIYALVKQWRIARNLES
ncbi:hypothetical protein SDC9_210655 [bioreactor metagenome]|uniref:Cation efflux system protein CusA n=1 Tax=bioreactor metagenome TaxID=1076179 RepID=A0A645JI52_9ZZZZ